MLKLQPKSLIHVETPTKNPSFMLKLQPKIPHSCWNSNQKSLIHVETPNGWSCMGILPLKKRVNRNKSQSWYQNRSQIFVWGTGSDFSEVMKSSKSGFFSLSKQALPVPVTKIWDLFWNQDRDVVSEVEKWKSLPATGKWFSYPFSFYIGLSHFIYLRIFKFRKRERTSPQNV